jgi:hypothetical protein
MSDGLPLNESGYGSGQHAVVIIEALSLVQLAHKIAERRGRKAGDNPGQVYAWGCKPIKIHKGDYENYQAICVASTYWDI